MGDMFRPDGGGRPVLLVVGMTKEHGQAGRPQVPGQGFSCQGELVVSEGRRHPEDPVKVLKNHLILVDYHASTLNILALLSSSLSVRSIAFLTKKLALAC